MSDYIIYGYCPTGEAVLHECVKRKWNIICYCDDSDVKRDHFEVSVPILSLKEIREQKKKGTFIIAVANCEQIIKKLSPDEEYILACEILDNPDEDVNFATKKPPMARRDVAACKAEQSAFLHPEKLFLKNVDLEITERCSLRCRDCSNLMQYYDRPKNFEPETLLRWMKDFSSYFDEIFEVRIIGGEPFMHPRMATLLSELLKLENIRVFTFYTNGTIVPPPGLLDIMATPRVGVSITDYGRLSRNIDKMTKVFDERNIIYDIHKSGLWTKCSSIQQMNRSRDDLVKTFENCCAKNLYTILDGKFFRCPFMANAMNLRAMPYITEDYVDIDSLSDNKADARKLLKSFMKKTYWAGCDYCLGRLFDSEEIEPAIQTPVPLPYRKV